MASYVFQTVLIRLWLPPPEKPPQLLTEPESPTKDADMLIDHLLDAKRKHDEDKNVEKEEVEHLDKGTNYLVSFLVGQGVQVSAPKKVTKQKPPGLEELKKKFVENLVEEVYVIIND